ncbi:hypothetical protein [Streptomyces lienomycini]|uniref:hypothetical protein n=1 Tax=Streptomyces lienomycini TaxID=284035 RepID=UPI0022FEB7D2|nr:hypothetical protein [Streptomyces lienomycini]
MVRAAGPALAGRAPRRRRPRRTPDGPSPFVLGLAFLCQPLLHWAGPVRHVARLLRGGPLVLGKTER